VCLYLPYVFSLEAGKDFYEALVSKRSLKRNDKKSGRKKPRRNDYDSAEVLPAPDSEEIEKIEPPYTPVGLTPKTPAKPVSSTTV
jgi:hypothetical protein